MEASFLRIEEVPECEGIEIVELPDMSEKCPVRLLSLYISKWYKNFQYDHYS